MKFKVPRKNYTVTELYDTVASLMGMDYGAHDYDCRRINVAANIQDEIFARYKEQSQGISEDDFNVGMAMLLLNYGPTVDNDLEDDEVEVFDGFILDGKEANA